MCEKEKGREGREEEFKDHLLFLFQVNVNVCVIVKKFFKHKTQKLGEKKLMCALAYVFVNKRERASEQTSSS